ncbi:NAD(P)H nitroreductase [Vibrio palustris]|uniref:Putative NAD(P)H nitroreductase n=1 Tax=Vibrio palustris TaxID=1918946 RepID=A0A1R4B1I4_9VIBR|nr:NAD(P)H nitroreductase [Vibrio palustris]SJL82778.1 Putative NAD(P)H nitroreductase YdjA [Vibrio palustris]
MDALEMLLNRRSMAKLKEPAPHGEVLENIIQAGLRAPDHGLLTPWRFVIAQGEGLDTLSAIFAEAEIKSGSDEVIVNKAKNAPKRAPMVITVIATVKPHEKVPALEQHLSAGCAVQAMQMAALAQGFQGMWRSGSWIFNENVKNAFHLEQNDQIVGFLYLGSPAMKPLDVPQRNSQDFVSYL